MSWVSPNYAKGLGKGFSEEELIELVGASFLVPVYEPIMIAGALVTTVSGDLLTAYAYSVPLDPI